MVFDEFFYINNEKGIDKKIESLVSVVNKTIEMILSLETKIHNLEAKLKRMNQPEIKIEQLKKPQVPMSQDNVKKAIMTEIKALFKKKNNMDLPQLCKEGKNPTLYDCVSNVGIKKEERALSPSAQK